jgi:hypothetical protein
MLVSAAETCNRALEIRLRRLEANRPAVLTALGGLPQPILANARIVYTKPHYFAAHAKTCLRSHLTAQQPVNNDKGAPLTVNSSNLSSPLSYVYPTKTVAKLQESDVTTK